MRNKILLIIAALFVVTSITGRAQIITTFAGLYKQQGYTGDNGPATQAKIDAWDMVFDQDGNMYFSDGWHAVIRKIDTKGIITTFAGNGTEGYSGDGGPAIAAKLRIAGLAIDKADNIYIGDDQHGVIRKIDRTGIIQTIAGTGTPGYSGDGGPAINAQFIPGWITVDKYGNIYISDHARVRKIDTNGIITTFAGNGVIWWPYHYPWYSNVPATQSPILPMGLTTDDTGNVYVACASNRIRKINTAGIVTTVAGDSIMRYNGDGIPATTASLAHAMDVDIDPEGNIIIADYHSHRIRKVNRSGIITTIAGTGVEGYSGDNGPAVKAMITFPIGIVTDRDGNIYFSDLTNFTIRKIHACKARTTPAVTITASAESICSGKAVTFTATPVNGGNLPSWQWQVNGKNVSDDSAVFTTDKLQPGDKVNCILTSSIDCSESVLSNTLAIEVNPIPVIDMKEEVIILPGTSIPLQAEISGNISTWQWSPYTSLSDPATATPIASPQQSTNYQLMVTSNKGCTATANITVVVYRKIMLPNAFTPNADNKNDIFRIPAGTSFEMNNFSIYNRWGGLVFKTNNLNEGWNGNINSQPAPAGLYIYSITGKDLGNKVVVKGTVLLLR